MNTIKTNHLTVIVINIIAMPFISYPFMFSESLHQLRLHLETIEKATRRWRPNLKLLAFGNWVQCVEMRNLIRRAQRHGEEKGMRNMHAFIDDGRELIC